MPTTKGSDPLLIWYGAGLRKILNYDAVDRVLIENGISSYTNVTVSQNTTLQDAIHTFSNIGLLISTHSSQLKLLAFSHPGMIVIELRPTESKHWHGHSVFSEGPDVMGIHYFSHCEHKADKCPMSPTLCKAKGNIYSNIWVNETSFSEVLSRALVVQGNFCKLDWK